jgi:hypothetical protein
MSRLPTPTRARVRACARANRLRNRRQCGQGWFRLNRERQEQAVARKQQELEVVRGGRPASTASAPAARSGPVKKITLDEIGRYAAEIAAGTAIVAYPEGHALAAPTEAPTERDEPRGERSTKRPPSPSDLPEGCTRREDGRISVPAGQWNNPACQALLSCGQAVLSVEK